MDLVVTDPVEADVYYFATSSHDAALGENFVGVYRMEGTTYNWVRVYKHTYKTDDGQSPTLLRVIARNGSDLYVVADRVNASRSAQTSVSAIGTVYVINLEKPLDGLKEVPTPLPAFLAEIKL
ncbi:hypothetical protein A2856_00610 [Candidatus Uhrbacteria bacterium RIFCSPHIGHO2_01_FULL_63_20]|uniref:Uncharacterized protein n=1 Tax=Candidatus Uhrbacteria bacterium RIFCSPHIGHO2_01_FULL_63_20 TaxID=1802385 RepID=A0A1F7TLW6_9BACT|nr:MAG: hypothetical protein A2856_00610 [Candidatus Uhrbacteria bacterium RIFCSPHIGHO2_01_FULL_63_20]